MLAIAFPFCCLRRYALLVVLKTGVVQPGDTEEGPPRTEGVVPFPRSERGGSGVAAQGVLQSLPITLALKPKMMRSPEISTISTVRSWPGSKRPAVPAAIFSRTPRAGAR